MTSLHLNHSGTGFGGTDRRRPIGLSTVIYEAAKQGNMPFSHVPKQALASVAHAKCVRDAAFFALTGNKYSGCGFDFWVRKSVSKMHLSGPVLSHWIRRLHIDAILGICENICDKSNVYLPADFGFPQKNMTQIKLPECYRDLSKVDLISEPMHRFGRTA
ncbi:MAG: hypothetical protein ABJQ23_21930 [Shimia thalassica]|uniref:hypothetical protein n=1 Tax=Shimia thalassica TaxID=1715693 RepID=UPI0032972346